MTYDIVKIEKYVESVFLLKESALFLFGEVMDMAKLTPKQQLFVEEYLIDLNATQAAIRAGYSFKNAGKIGPELVGKTRVAEAIGKEMAKRSKRTGVSQDRVIFELARIAFANGADFAKIVTKPIKSKVWNHKTEEYEDEEIIQQFVELINTDELSADKKAAITAIKETKFGVSVETADKVKALELIGRHLGMFTDKLKVEGSVPVIIIDDLGEDDDEGE